METTLNISDETLARLKQEAARRGRTISEIVEESLAGLLPTSKAERTAPPLPSFHGGVERVNIADRNALYDVMER